MFLRQRPKSRCRRRRFDNNSTTADAITPANLAAGFTIDAAKAWTERGLSSGNDVLFVKDTARTLESDGVTAISAQSYRGMGVATPTTINAAFLARTQASSRVAPIGYGGGLNNYMGILESWTSIAMTYRGSFVSLGDRQEVNGAYIAGGSGATVYGNPPIRNWAYETNFDTFSKLPPLSPRVINLKQDVFKRNY